MWPARHTSTSSWAGPGLIRREISVESQQWQQGADSAGAAARTRLVSSSPTAQPSTAQPNGKLFNCCRLLVCWCSALRVRTHNCPCDPVLVAGADIHRALHLSPGCGVPLLVTGAGLVTCAAPAPALLPAESQNITTNYQQLLSTPHTLDRVEDGA